MVDALARGLWSGLKVDCINVHFHRAFTISDDENLVFEDPGQSN